MSELEKIVDVILTGKRFLIASHENPDGDAIGSMLALGLSLESIGKEVVFYDKDGAPLFLQFLPCAGRIKTSLNPSGENFSATFALDCTDTERPGKEFEKFTKSGKCGTVIIIDHHQTTKPSADIHLLDPRSSSTGMIIYSLLKALRLQISADAAKCIYTTIVGDTGSFNYSNTNAETFRVAAELVDLGVNPSEISEAIYENEPLKRVKLLALILPTLEVTEDGRIASVVANREMFRATGTSRGDTDGVVNFPRAIKGVEVAVLFREEEPDENDSRWKISLRSKGKINVAQVAEKFGGGGHERASGCSVSGALADARRRIFGSISEAMDWTE